MSIKQFYKIQNKIVSRTWRHKPTYPVLPSWGTEFVCIKGIIERIDLEEEYNYFEFVSKSAVENRIINARIHVVRSLESNFEKFRKRVLAKQVNPFLIRANFINVQINGVIYRGWIGDCPFQAGEEVAVIAQWQEDHYELYALAKPDERIISICPNCSKGRIAYLIHQAKATLFLILSFMILFNVFYILVWGSLYQLLHLTAEYISFMKPIFFGSSIFCSIGMIIESIPNVNKKAKIAEKIFKTLNLPKIARMDLRRFTNKKVAKLKQKKQHNSVKPSKRFFLG
ncbi:putative type VI secretion system effector, partial [Gilliamella apis]